VSISLSISQSINEDPNSDDLVTIGNYLIKLALPYEALLTYEFFLPENEKQKYIDSLSEFVKRSIGLLTGNHQETANTSGVNDCKRH